MIESAEGTARRHGATGVLCTRNDCWLSISI